MLFGHGGLDYFALPDNLRFTEDIGWLIYAFWHIAVVMFLMKILIGLTSAVYSKIEVIFTYKSVLLSNLEHCYYSLLCLVVFWRQCRGQEAFPSKTFLAPNKLE